MLARWKLGKALAAIERGTGPGRGKKAGAERPSFRAYLRDVLNGQLKDTAAKEAMRIGALPDGERARSAIINHALQWAASSPIREIPKTSSAFSAQKQHTSNQVALCAPELRQSCRIPRRARTGCRLCRSDRLEIAALVHPQW
jgi:hypothetical protein